MSKRPRQRRAPIARRTPDSRRRGSRSRQQPPARRLQTLLRLRIPSALPYFFGGLRIASGLSLIGAVVAEFVAGTGGTGTGLAYQILQAGYQLNIPRMFAALVLIAATGVALFVLMGALSRRALGGWHESALRTSEEAA